MTEILATNITSPLGLTTLQNYRSVREGASALKEFRDWRGVPGQVCVAAFEERQKEAMMLDGFSWFESLAVYSVREALGHADIDASSERTVFILSTTKGDVEQLSATEAGDGAYLAPADAARKIASCLGITTEPVVVCNACISGVTAQLLADRLISNGTYDNAIVCGADVLSTFTVAGFSSFKSLSPVRCRPFDIERLGLNLGEAAASVILGRRNPEEDSGRWCIVSGCLNNDAYHVSAPAPDGEGVLRAVQATVDSRRTKRLATVSAHGTATMFNDQMESKAIAAAGLGAVPVSAYKGVFGHTLGASGVLEPVITMCGLDEGVVLPVCGFEEIGVSGKIDVCGEVRQTRSREFLKIISGFGGCNGAVLYSGTPDAVEECSCRRGYELAGTIHVTPDAVTVNGTDIQCGEKGGAMLTALFKERIADGPKFFKMDLFSKLVYVSVSLLADNGKAIDDPGSAAMVLFNRSSSIVADRQHLGTFSTPGEFYPSPSVFLYTLPNVVLGELASRYGIKGETSFFILPEKDWTMMDTIIGATLAKTTASSLVSGWVDCSGEDTFEAEIKLLKIK